MFNNGILRNGVLIPKLLNNPSAPCSFINLDFLLPHTAHFDDKFNLSFLHLYSLYFFYTLNNMSACSFYNITNHFFYYVFVFDHFICMFSTSQAITSHFYNAGSIFLTIYF